MKKLLGAVGVFLMVLIASCKMGAKIDVTGDWELVGVNKMDGSGKANPQDTGYATITIDSDADTYPFMGFSGVNTFNGTFVKKDKKSIAVPDEIATTKMGGPIELLEQESVFLDQIENTQSWIVANENGEDFLEITCKSADMDANTMDTTVLRFRRIKLPGTKYNITSCLAGQGVESVDSELTIEFTDDKALVFTGLNNLELPYVVDSKTHKLTISQSGLSTLTSGSDMDMATEKSLLLALLQVQSYGVLGRELSFYSGMGRDDTTLLMTSERAE